MVQKIKNIWEQILEKATPMIEERVGVLKEEAAEEFKNVNEKLDKIIGLLEK